MALPNRPTDEEIRTWIDSATYRELLFKWRFEPIGSPFFAGPVGEYFSHVMERRRQQLADSEHERISKEIGWHKP